jgi:N-acetylmuramoyl-L-alanine amidase
MLAGLVVVVDVQHAYRTGIHAADRGTLYAFSDGTHAEEADLSAHYAARLAADLRAMGASVFTNDPARGKLVGAYLDRQRQATLLSADVYLACHTNAGRGSYAAVEYATVNPGRGLAMSIASELDRTFFEINNGKAVELVEGERGMVCVRGFTRGPALILEPLFPDNPDHQRLCTHDGLELVGSAIARGIQGWWAASRTA